MHQMSLLETSALFVSFSTPYPSHIHPGHRVSDRSLFYSILNTRTHQMEDWNVTEEKCALLQI